MEKSQQLLMTNQEQNAVIKLVQTQLSSLDYNEYATEKDYIFWENLLTKLTTNYERLHLTPV